MRIAAYGTVLDRDAVTIRDSTGDEYRSGDIAHLFAFILEQAGDDVLQICWNLDQTVAPMLRLLGEDSCRGINESGKLYMPPFDIFYIPGKVFSVRHIPSRQKANLYDLEQYYPDLPVAPSGETEIEYLGRGLMVELGQMGLYPKKLTSPVAIYEECVLNHLDLPVVADMPMEAAEYSYRASGRLWIEAHRLGYWPDGVYNYDMISAFPTVAAQLGDIRNCEWAKTEAYVEEAAYGYCRCKVTIYDNVTVSPILMEEEDGSLLSPVGTFEAYLTKGELDFITKWEIGNWFIEDGWWAVPKHTWALPRPLEVPMNRVLKYKQKTGLQGMIAKRQATGIYGKFGEEHKDSFGKHFNPCWFAEISTRTRLQVAEFIYRHDLQDSLIHVGVDGVLVDREAELDKSDVGAWRLSGISPVLVVSSGLVFTGNKKPKGLTLDEVLAMIKEHPREGYYAKPIVRRITLGEALNVGFDSLGRDKALNTSINLYRHDFDRDFPKWPDTGEQLLRRHYRSRPIKVRKED